MVVARGRLRYRARTVPRALLSQAAYARRRGISQQAVWKRTTTAGGPIPVHGPQKRLDVAEADALWDATKSPQGEGGAPAAAAPPDAPPVVDASLYARAKAMRMAALAKREALELRIREGELVDRAAVQHQVEGLAQEYFDGWRRWPARVGPVVAQRLGGLDATVVVELLHELVEAHLATLVPRSHLDVGH